MANLFIVILIAAAILVAALAFAKALGRGGKREGEYRVAGNALFSRGEQAFLGVLDASLPPGVRLFGKVRLSDIFEPSGSVPRDGRFRALSRINQKHVDFLLVDARTLSPLAGVELDDSTHEAAHRRARDAFVDSVFQGAGLPLIHIPASREYNRREIAGIVARALS